MWIGLFDRVGRVFLLLLSMQLAAHCHFALFGLLFSNLDSILVLVGRFLVRTFWTSDGVSVDILLLTHLLRFCKYPFSKYSQDCRLGVAGYFNILAVLCYLICNLAICCAPRPQPLFNNVMRSQTTKRIKKRTRDVEEVDDMN